ncbi:hypothetical protein ACFQD2_22365 [Pseudomonas lini]
MKKIILLVWAFLLVACSTQREEQVPLQSVSNEEQLAPWRKAEIMALQSLPISMSNGVKHHAIVSIVKLHLAFCVRVL